VVVWVSCVPGSFFRFEPGSSSLQAPRCHGKGALYTPYDECLGGLPCGCRDALPGYSRTDFLVAVYVMLQCCFSVVICCCDTLLSTGTSSYHTCCKPTGAGCKVAPSLYARQLAGTPSSVHDGDRMFMQSTIAAERDALLSAQHSAQLQGLGPSQAGRERGMPTTACATHS